MTVRILLLRGINVGGNNKLAMVDLKRHVADAGGKRVQTYIQSGNVVFSGGNAKKLALLPATIAAEHGFRPSILELSADDLTQVAVMNPFPAAAGEPATLHCYFCADDPTLDAGRLAGLCGQTERYQLIERCFYLHAPDGIARSKLAAGAEKALGVATTARNWRTVVKLQELAEHVANG